MGRIEDPEGPHGAGTALTLAPGQAPGAVPASINSGQRACTVGQEGTARLPSGASAPHALHEPDSRATTMHHLQFFSSPQLIMPPGTVLDASQVEDGSREPERPERSLAWSRQRCNARRPRRRPAPPARSAARRKDSGHGRDSPARRPHHQMHRDPLQHIASLPAGAPPLGRCAASVPDRVEADSSPASARRKDQREARSFVPGSQQARPRSARSPRVHARRRFKARRARTRAQSRCSVAERHDHLRERRG